MKHTRLTLFITFLFPLLIKAQPFIDVVNFNYSFFHSQYKDSLHREGLRTDFNVNFFLPKVFENGNTFLFKLSAEELTSEIDSTNVHLYSFAAPVGFQFLSKNKKWKTLVMGIPRISSDLKDDLSQDVQYGGTGLITYVLRDSCKLKFGLYYNRECFGNFFVPLVGIDWKISEHFSVYGILPNNMRVEYQTNDHKFFAGLGYRNFQRSYRLSGGFHDDYIRVKESQVKVFAECFLWKKILLSAELGYTLKYDLAQYNSDYTVEQLPRPVYTPVKNDFIITTALAYRIRQ
jgi:hypothetical protein